MLHHVKVVHDKIKDLKCDYCDAMFGSPNTRRQHMISKHLKIKAHACPVCDRKFAARHAMVSHAKIVHGVNAAVRANARFQPKEEPEPQPEPQPDQISNLDPSIHYLT
jgi:hypothetical protein